jgi:hypothetical protein
MKRSWWIMAAMLAGCSGAGAGAGGDAEAKAKLLGISVYPGATEAKPTDKPAAATAPDEKNVRLFLESKDAADKVAQYYAKETGIASQTDGNGFSLMGKTKAGAFLIIGIESVPTGSKITATGLVAK